MPYIIEILLILSITLCASLPLKGLAQEGVLPNQESISKTLSLRLKPKEITLERPNNSALKISNGSTVIFQNGTLSGVISPKKTSSPIKLVPNTSLSEIPSKSIQPIEMRIINRSIFLDRSVELFIVQDITGRNVMTVINSHKVILTDLRSGVYMVRVQDKGATHTSKFILR